MLEYRRFVNSANRSIIRQWAEDILLVHILGLRARCPRDERLLFNITRTGAEEPRSGKVEIEDFAGHLRIEVRNTAHTLLARFKILKRDHEALITLGEHIGRTWPDSCNRVEQDGTDKGPMGFITAGIQAGFFERIEE